MKLAYPMANLEPGDHLCCLYQTEEEHRAVLTPFLRQGLERDEKVLYILDAHTPEAILGYLRDDGLDVEPYLSRGQLAIVTRGDSYMREGVIDPERMIELRWAETEQAVAEGYQALRVTGEMTWALRGLPASEVLIEYEARLRYSRSERAINPLRIKEEAKDGAMGISTTNQRYWHRLALERRVPGHDRAGQDPGVLAA